MILNLDCCVKSTIIYSHGHFIADDDNAHIRLQCYYTSYSLLVWCLGVGRLVTHLANQREDNAHNTVGGANSQVWTHH